MWGAETSYAEVKMELHMDMDVLRSRSVERIEREIEPNLAAYNSIRLQMLRAATEEGVDPRELSFVHAVRTLGRVCQIVPRTPAADHPALPRTRRQQIAAGRIRQRPGRQEPRAVKRPPKPYPRLRGSRDECRKLHARAA